MKIEVLVTEDGVFIPAGTDGLMQLVEHGHVGARLMAIARDGRDEKPKKTRKPRKPRQALGSKPEVTQ